MDDPTLTRTSVQINYTASDGYRAEVGYSSTRAATPQAVFIDAIDELARLCELFGYGQDAQQAFEDARHRVAEWRAVRTDHESHPALAQALDGPERTPGVDLPEGKQR